MNTNRVKRPRISAKVAVTHSKVRLIANLEATSFLLLIVCIVLKNAGPKIGGPLLIMGWIHGVLFLAFIAVIIGARQALGWTTRRAWLAAVSSVIPLAPYFVAHSEPDSGTAG